MKMKNILQLVAAGIWVVALVLILVGFAWLVAAFAEGMSVAPWFTISVTAIVLTLVGVVVMVIADNKE